MVESGVMPVGALVALLEPPGSESSTALRDTLARAAAGARLRYLSIGLRRPETGRRPDKEIQRSGGWCFCSEFFQFPEEGLGSVFT